MLSQTTNISIKLPSKPSFINNSNYFIWKTLKLIASLEKEGIIEEEKLNVLKEQFSNLQDDLERIKFEWQLVKDNIDKYNLNIYAEFEEYELLCETALIIGPYRNVSSDCCAKSFELIRYGKASNIDDLFISQQTISVRSIEILAAAIEENTNLKEIYFANNCFSDIAFLNLCKSFANNKSIIKMKLPGLEEAKMEYLSAALACNTSIQFISISGYYKNPDKVITALSEALKKNSSLKYIDFNIGILKDNHLIILADACKDNKIEINFNWFSINNSYYSNRRNRNYYLMNTATNIINIEDLKPFQNKIIALENEFYRESVFQIPESGDNVYFAYLSSYKNEKNSEDEYIFQPLSNPFNRVYNSVITKTRFYWDTSLFRENKKTRIRVATPEEILIIKQGLISGRIVINSDTDIIKKCDKLLNSPSPKNITNEHIKESKGYNCAIQ
ncbi:MAG: hypothetical protein J0H68_03375 [Sphingobacteriia bacterium]|nr:hypothetical protein [Sphingobacteriia bacterium]